MIHSVPLEPHLSIFMLATEVVDMEEASKKLCLSILDRLCFIDDILDVSHFKSILKRRLGLQLSLDPILMCRPVLLFDWHFLKDRIVKHASAVECHDV